MVDVGDKVLVFAAGSEFATAVPLITPGIGDKVALYNLQNETRIAVPTLVFGVGDISWVTPNFDFAGFNFNLDFNFQLIPLILGLASGIYGIVGIVDYDMPYGVPEYLDYIITISPNYNRTTWMGYQGWFIAKWADDVNLHHVTEVEIYESTGWHTYTLKINPNDYIYPAKKNWKPSSESEEYEISFIYPNKIRIYCIASYPYQRDVGHIQGCLIRI